MANNPTVIAAHLDSSALEKSINALVEKVADKTQEMAGKFEGAMDIMKASMKDFAITQKVSVDLMKDAWREMSSAFDAMVKAQEAAKGTNTKGQGADPNTVRGLDQLIAQEEARRKGMQLDSQELLNQNQLLSDLKQQRKEQLMTEKELDEYYDKQNQKLEKQKAKKLKEQQQPYTYAFNKANTESSKDLASAEQKLRNLKTAVADMRKSGLFDEVKLNKAQKAIDTLEQKIERMRAKRPITMKDVLGMDESSLDAIAKKMNALKRVSVNPNDAAQVKAVGDEYQRLAKLKNDLMGKTVQETGVNNALARSFGYIRNRLVYALTIGAMTSFVKQIYEVRSQYELLERSLGVLVNSFENGTRIFKELNEMALQSPFTLIELGTAAKQLTAYNFEAKEVVDTTRRLADISAALGVPMERLTYNLGQIRAQTVLTARDARDFANAGLPIVAALAEQYTELEGKIVTTGDVYGRLSKKMVSFSDVMAVLNKMTDEGGKFFDFQAKQAETLKVQMANLSLAWNNMLNDLGESHQSLLTAPITMFKGLLKGWREIDKVIKDVVISFGLMKLAQIAMVRLGLSATVQGLRGTLKMMAKTRAAAMSLKASFMALAANPFTWVFVAIAALTDLIITVRRNREENEKLNETIAKNAEESAKSLEKFLKLEGNVNARQSARSRELSSVEAEKTWEGIRNEIENSSAAADTFIRQLMSIDDLNDRVSKGFDIAEKIKDANNALSGLINELEVDKDTWLYGLFGEGLAEDLEDYAEEAAKYFKYIRENAEDTTHNLDWFTSTSKKEALDEIAEFADEAASVIRNRLGEEGVLDVEKVTEAIRRIVKEVELANPQIKGAGRDLFELELDRIFAEKFAQSGYSGTVALWNKVLEHIKKDTSSAFSGITDDILDKNAVWSDDQLEAIQKAIDKVRNEVPLEFHDVLNTMQRDLNSREWKINITTTFGVEQLDEYQKEQRNRFVKAPFIFTPDAKEEYERERTTRFGDLLRKKGEDDIKYEKRLQDEKETTKKAIERNTAALESESEALRKEASAEKALNEQRLADIEELQRVGNYRDKEDKKKRGRGGRKEEDVVAQALKQEISLINEMRSNYDKLRKAGVSNTQAIEMASRGYEATILRINNVLQKFGIDKFNARNFAGKNVKELLDSLTKQRDALLASGEVKTSSLKDMEVEIQKLTIDAKTYDLKKITDGLNNELGKLKDEYELSVELDANPELGNMFADMFGIDVTELPHTFQEAYAKANEIAKNELKKLNIDIKDFDLMSTRIVPDSQNLWQGMAMDADVVEALIKNQKTWQEMFKKNMLETEKMLDDYVKQYGDYSDKIAEIERDRLGKIKKLNEAYFTEEMRRKPEYLAKQRAINEGANKEKQKVKFDEFKNSRFYTAMFENLDYVSTQVIRDMRDKVRDLIDKMNNLTPEQLKHMMSQYEKLQQKLAKRSPFKTLTKDFKEYVKQSKDRKAANQAFSDADKEYRAQQKVVAELKEKYEQQKSNFVLSPAIVEETLKELGVQEEILRKLKEQLDAAQQKADKYNLIKKLALQELAVTAQVVSQNLQSLAALRDSLRETFGVEMGDEMDGFIDGLSKTGDGISSIVSSAQNADVFGIVNGVVGVFSGIGDGIASLFGDGSARTKRLQKEIERSEEVVRRLNMAYKELERAVDSAMGAEELRARRSQIANKKAELAELERQMKLEQSKRSKDRDDEKIKQYQERIQDLTFEIEDAANAIQETLLGSSIKSAAEEFVSTWVSAWRQGEDTMEALGGKFDDVIDNMIAKSVASYLVSRRLQSIFDTVDEFSKETSEGGAEITLNELKQLKNLMKGKTVSELINEDLTNLYNALGIPFGVAKEAESNLSALQQGIQGVTEDTASAIEAYMNIVAQRVFEHGIILAEIRDAVMAFDMDVQLGTMSQILLQLQASYQTQNAIRNILEGVLTPSGRAFMVELN